MEKVKITQEQANAIKRWVNKEQLIIAKASGFFEHSMDEPIAELTMEQLVKSLYIGYEVEPEFSCEVGDWIKDTSTGAVFQVKDTQHRNNVMDSRYTTKRHATPEEIAEEKGRRWWRKHGRDVWELRKGDLLKDNHFGKITEVREVEDRHYLIGAITSYEPLDFIKRNYTVVCFAEQRLDREGD